MDTYEAAMNKDKHGLSPLNALLTKKTYEVGNMVVTSGAFDKNEVHQKPAKYLLRKYTPAHPERIFKTLKENPDIPFQGQPDCNCGL